MIILDSFYQLLKYSFFLNGRLDIWPLSGRENRNYSPIGIDTKNAERKEMSPLIFHNYNKKLTANLENSGETVYIKPAESRNLFSLPNISGSILPSNYVLDNVHFHWNSEHTIDGKTYALEGHFLHYDMKRLTLENALKFDDGVVVLAVLFEEKISFNSTLKEIAKSVRKVSNKTHESVEMPNKINFYSLLPKSTDRFYTYEGSLDWPTARSVKWIVFEVPTFISTRQLEEITKIYGENNIRIVKNSRMVQSLNGREVVYVHHTGGALTKMFNFLEEKLKEYLGFSR